MHLREFRNTVKPFHKARIEVILDVVSNHTDEGNPKGPTFCSRGIDNRSYYFFVPSSRQYYLDYSDCGTFNCNHPIAKKFIVDCLRYGVRETHVDGFRFDEGSILLRGEDGTPSAHHALVWQVELDEDLMETKLIAEAWDAAGLYQIGHFPGDRWGEWNGRFRDTMRRFVKGETLESWVRSPMPSRAAPHFIRPGTADLLTVLTSLLAMMASLLTTWLLITRSPMKQMAK